MTHYEKIAETVYLDGKVTLLGDRLENHYIIKVIKNHKPSVEEFTDWVEANMAYNKKVGIDTNINHI